MTASARIILAGSPEFAVPALRWLADSPHEVVAVLTQPDRPAGRGRKLAAGPVKRVALGYGLPVLQPETLKNQSIQDQLRGLDADLMVVAAYGLLLPPAVLEIPRRGCVNLHASLLPRWRGASPIQAALLAGDTETGISLMQMEQGLDTGPVLARAPIEIGATETAGQLDDRLATLGAETLAQHLDAILEARIEPEAQDSAEASYAGAISKADAVIDWSRDAQSIDRQIRAYNPWPVAETRRHGKQLRCWGSRVAGVGDATVQPPGQVIAIGADGIDVATGGGVLRLTELQLPGRRRTPAADLGRSLGLVGEVLGA